MTARTPLHPLALSLTIGLGASGCDLPGSDDDTGSAPATSDTDSPVDPTGEGTSGDGPGSTGPGDDGPDDDGPGGGDSTGDVPPADGEITCTQARLHIGNPMGDPALGPQSGDPAAGSTPDGPNLATRTIATVPGQPEMSVIATGPELWAMDGTAGTIRRILGDEEASEFRAGACAEARIGNVSDIAFRSDGRLYAGDHSGNAVVEIVDPLGPDCEMRYYAGTQQDVFTSALPHESGNADGDASVARFAGPDWLAVDENDDIWVVDKGNRSIRRIDTADQVTTVLELPSEYIGGSGAVSVFEILPLSGKLYMPAKGSVQSSQNATVLVFDLASAELQELATGRDDPWLVGSSGPSIAGIVHAEGDLLLTWVNGRVFTVDASTGDVQHVAGDGDKPWALADFAPGYDAFGEHDAMDVELDNMSATVTGAASFLHYAGDRLYVSATAQGNYVTALDCE